MKKNYLLTPGPTPIDPEIQLEMAKPIIHHRTPQFRAIFQEVNVGLKYIFQTENSVITFTSSGTGAMEAAVGNLLSRGDKALVIQGGKFGERWKELCDAYGVNVELIDVTWGEAVEVGHVREIMEENPDIKAVYSTLCETSTGVETDIASIARITKDHQAVLVVDAISALGATQLKTDEWGVDVVVAGSQKGLMIPPGLSFVSISKKAWDLIADSKSSKYYFDLTKAKKALDKNDVPFTPAISLVIGLKVALNKIKSEGLDKILKKFAGLSDATRGAMKALGLELFAKSPSNAVTAVNVPEGVDGEKLIKILRDELGVSIAGGQSHLKGKIFRIAHMGFIDTFDIIVAISAVEIGLSRLGYKVEFGKGVGAAEKILKEEIFQK